MTIFISPVNWQKHSVRCTEQFARENVLEEMKGLNVTPESKQRMLEALQRIHFDDEGRSVFEDDYMQVLNGEGEEPSEIGKTLWEDLACSKDYSYSLYSVLPDFYHMFHSYGITYSGIWRDFFLIISQKISRHVFIVDLKLIFFRKLYLIFWSFTSFRYCAKCTSVIHHILLFF